jgi:polyhydroxyalkanoate synthase subunit PhaC
MELAYKAAREMSRVLTYVAAASTNPDPPPCIEPLPGDYRFRAEGWQKQPYSFWAQAFLLSQQWWHKVTHAVPGITPTTRRWFLSPRANSWTCSLSHSQLQEALVAGNLVLTPSGFGTGGIGSTLGLGGTTVTVQVGACMFQKEHREAGMHAKLNHHRGGLSA